MRIGFFGGSFDPPHLGHLAAAEAASKVFNLDLVLLAPVAVQPLKRREGFASFTNRLHMVELLCYGNSRLAAADVDAARADGQPNYTVATLHEVQTTYPEAALFCIAGIDSFSSLPQWHRPDELLHLAEWIVVSRPGTSFADLAGLQLSPEQRTRVHLLDTVHVPVSATEIRTRLAAGESCQGLLPSSVLAYIRERGLYGTQAKDAGVSVSVK